ncbi:hypothetical protein [Massilia rubra]|uniref:Uncharacterized protein n=1 Tax=Massilia rubra TaxID=2607910 RepID=A0ABX0LTY8_9BURK|nr:hypothetical protein [Massilia rubra]NHZ35820.1 hypothetical protein [Massilia rubra]
MIKTSLFTEHEREAKVNKLGDAFKVMEQHVNFFALADAVDEAAPRPAAVRTGAPRCSSTGRSPLVSSIAW